MHQLQNCYNVKLTSYITRLFIKPGTQEQRTECRECMEREECSLWFRKVSERIPGNVLILAFRRMLGKIPGNVQKDFGECFRGFRECWRRSWGILLKIPRNVPEDSWGGSRSFREMFKRSPGNVQEDSGESKFRYISWKLACFLSNFAVKLLRNNGKKRLLSNFPKESTFFTTTYD